MSLSFSVPLFCLVVLSVMESCVLKSLVKIVYLVFILPLILSVFGACVLKLYYQVYIHLEFLYVPVYVDPFITVTVTHWI